MTGLAVVILLGLFTVKHFLADFLYQPPYQWMNKGTYGHPGGFVHAGQHGLLTTLILVGFTTPLIAASLALIEFIVHYHIDWAKMNINAKYGWKCNETNNFWILLGVDQLLHGLTYIGIALALVLI